MDKLRVRVYNVRFGDAILISIPDRGSDGSTTMRHILIDVGNSYSGEGGQDAAFIPVVENALETLGGKPLDLYIMTHEHMDHVQGLLYANQKAFTQADLRQRLAARHAWLTASSAANYYETHPQAREKALQASGEYEKINSLKSYLDDAKTPMPAAVLAILEINNPRLTKDCVDYLRQLAEQTWYVYRGCDLNEKHPFQEAKFEIWAPEEDTSEYYGAFQPVTFGLAAGSGKAAKAAPILPIPPPGVDARAFYNLVEARKSGWADNLLAIDQAANNTSIVFCLEWREWKLLFTADAELRSWKIMEREGMLKPVDFLKVGHHGSHNATPPDALLEKILPKKKLSRKPRFAVVSTYDNTYSGVPEAETLQRVKSRCRLRDTRKLRDGKYFDFEFEAE